MSTFNGRIPLFNGNNFLTWKTQMEAILHKNRLLNIVMGEEKCPKVPILPQNATSEQRTQFETKMETLKKFKEKDMDARAEILISLEANIVSMVRHIKSSSEMWKHLEDTFDRKTIRKKIECYRKLLNFKMSENQSVSEFLIEFDVCAASIREMGVELDEDLLAVIIVDALPEVCSKRLLNVFVVKRKDIKPANVEQNCHLRKTLAVLRKKQIAWVQQKLL